MSSQHDVHSSSLLVRNNRANWVWIATSKTVNQKKKPSDFLNRCSHLNKIRTNIIARILFLHHIQDFVQFVKGRILAVFHFAMKGTASLSLMLHHSVITGNVSTEHLEFWSSSFSTVLGILRELTRPQADAWHHPFLQIRKAAHVLAAPQCPTEIEWEERSSWQDLSLGTHEHEQQEGLPATWSEKYCERWLPSRRASVESH